MFHVFSNNNHQFSWIFQFYHIGEHLIIQFSWIFSNNPIFSEDNHMFSNNHNFQAEIIELNVPCSKKYIELPWITAGQLEKIELMARSF